MEKTLKFQHDKSSIPVLLCFLPDGHACDLPLHGRQTFGRTGRGADLCVPSPYISGRHGEFGIIQGRIMYRDTGSTNGTWINGQPCTSIQEILPGDIFTFYPKNAPRGTAAFRMIPVYLKHYPLTWRSVPLSPDIREIMVGRGEGAFRLEDPYISTRHATFFNSAQGWTIIDLGSTNGVFINTRRIEGASKLSPGDIIQIGATWFYFTGRALCFGTASVPVTASGTSLDGTVHGMTVEKPSAEVKMQERPSSLKGSLVANAHGQVPASGYGFDNRPEAPDAGLMSRLEDSIRAEAAATEDESVGKSLMIDIRKRDVWHNFRKRTLLSDIKLTINPGDFVLILGGSGAGKSTFLKAVMGYNQAEGTILYGDLDVYREYEEVKYEIGYVPQKDLVRLNDTVYNTLLAAAQMRMPASATNADHVRQTEWAMSLLGLTDERNNMASMISGGQLKRLSIATELVGNPSLFFLDEPDSGLDGPMSRDLMMSLRKVADLGKIVLIITHGPDRSIDLFTKVIVLGKTEKDNIGHLLYFGTPENAKTFFETDSLEGIIRRINRKSENGDGLADHFLEKYNRMRGNT
ncbi:MAG: FHA domain-containing protein [Eubacteriales bacterium]